VSFDLAQDSCNIISAALDAIVEIDLISEKEIFLKFCGGDGNVEIPAMSRVKYPSKNPFFQRIFRWLFQKKT
tara:strand:+ start:656 stop:871 length:216 start_codon:yes stop_codon:yes gene_type:complete